MRMPWSRSVPPMSLARRSIDALLLIGLAGCGARIVPAEGPGPMVERSDISATVFLIGDAGAPRPGGEPVLLALEALLATAPDSTLVLFLGDNVYPRGVPDPGDPGAPEAERRLAAQVALSARAPVVFIPGNHDWDKSGAEGWDRIRRQGRLIAEQSGGRARLVPEQGCPGPARLDLGTGLRLLLLDTEWWLHHGEKPGAGSECPEATQAEVVAALQVELAEGWDRQVIVAAHHPLLSGGPHGGYFGVMDHLFPLREVNSALFIPLPVIGSAYPIARSNGASDQDMSGAANIQMRAALESAFVCYPPAIFAAGHEHGLQVLDRGAAPLLAVSGAGIYGHTSPLRGMPETRLALSEAGFMRVDLLLDGRLRLSVLTVDRAGMAHQVYATMLPAAGRERVAQCAG